MSLTSESVNPNADGLDETAAQGPNHTRDDRPAALAMAAIPIGLFLIGVIVVFIHERGFEYDDSYIWFRYIQNFANGCGAAYNCGGDHYEGFTSFAWLILAGSVRALIHVDTRWLVKILGAVFYAVAVTMLIYLVTRTCLRSLSRRWTAVLPGIVVALVAVLVSSGPLWAISGMETGLYSFSLVLFVWIASNGGRPWLCSIAFTILFLSRIEAFMLLPLPVIVDLIMMTNDLPLPGTRFSEFRRRVGTYFPSWIRYLIGSMGAVGVITLFRLIYFHDPIPGTVLYKVPTSLSSNAGAGWSYLKGFALEFRSIGILFLGSAVFILIARRHRPAIGACLAIAAQTLFIIWVGGDWMGWWRFIAPFVPLIAMAIAFAVAQALELRRFDIGFLVLTCILLYAAIAPSQSIYDAAWPGSGMGLSIRSVNERVGLSLRSLTHPNDVIAVGDAGAIPYFSRRPIVDLHGLLDRHLAAYDEHHGMNFTLSPLSVVDVGYVLSRNPACFVIIAGGLENTAAGKLSPYPLYNQILNNKEFRRKYTYLEEDPLFAFYDYQVWCDGTVMRRAALDHIKLLS